MGAGKVIAIIAPAGESVNSTGPARWKAMAGARMSRVPAPDVDARLCERSRLWGTEAALSAGAVRLLRRVAKIAEQANPGTRFNPGKF